MNETLEGDGIYSPRFFFYGPFKSYMEVEVLPLIQKIATCRVTRERERKKEKSSAE